MNMNNLTILRKINVVTELLGVLLIFSIRCFMIHYPLAAFLFQFAFVIVTSPLRYTFWSPFLLKLLEYLKILEKL
jgi:hypothetical protein